MSYIILGLLLYILYRFIFGFVIPVISASRKMQQQMRDMHEKANGFNNNTPPFNGRPTQNKTTTSSNEAPSSKDYIDFEEVK